MTVRCLALVFVKTKVYTNNRGVDGVNVRVRPDIRCVCSMLAGYHFMTVRFSVLAKTEVKNSHSVFNSTGIHDV